MKTLSLQILTGVVAATAAFGVSAAGPGLSLADRMELARPALARATGFSVPGRAAAPAADIEERYALVAVADGHSSDELVSGGATVICERGGIALVSMPAVDVERVALLDCVKRFELSRIRHAHLDKARAECGVDKIHSGAGLDRAYTGKGVVVGVMDSGIQPMHANFRNPDGSTRFKLLANIYEASNPNGCDIDYYGSDAQRFIDYWENTQGKTPKDIEQFSSDTYSTYHGSHTLGILTGSYSGKVKTSATTEADNPYIGVAPGADIAAACGNTSDMFIALGTSSIADYADMVKKPAVISLSLGSNIGSHTANTLMGTWLDFIGGDYPVVVSAGNEGNVRLACRKTLTGDDTELKTFILPTSENKDERYGEMYVYSSQPFTIQAVLFNKNRGKIAYRMPAPDEGGTMNTYSTEDSGIGGITSPQLDNAFIQSAVQIGTDITSDTEEHVGILTYMTKDNPETNADANYILGFVILGQAGQRIEAYCDGVYSEFDDYDQAGWDDGSCDGTINDMACGNNTICVGSFNTRDTYPLMAGGEAGYADFDFTYGNITPYSSWATFPDRESLPHVCAPGAAIISSINSDYVEAVKQNPDIFGEDYLDRFIVVSHTASDGTVSYWGPTHGTSMATPYVAGGIALWLEAYPQLTPVEIKDIIKNTAVKDAQVTAGIQAQWGAGKFDAYAGLQEALRMRAAGMEPVLTDKGALTVKSDGRLFSFFMGGVSSMNVQLWNLDGRLVASATSPSDEVTVDTTPLTPGVYVARINDNISKRIIVK